LSPIYQHLVERTHLYASQAINAAQYPVTGHTFHHTWVPMTVEEIKKFLGLTFITGNKQTKTKMFRADYFVFDTPVFPKNAFLHS
jgi:hypothetical protein